MVVAKKAGYEESRQKRLEENKKRMEQLNLNKLAQALHTPKSSPVSTLNNKIELLLYFPIHLNKHVILDCFVICDR